jgi:hypothetical protein
MNDPGLHESANEAAQDVEKNEPEEVDQAEQDEQEFLDPRYASWRIVSLNELTLTVAGGSHPQHVH